MMLRVALVCAATMSCLAPTVMTSENQRSTEAWAKVIEAKGGVERLHKITVLAWSADYPSRSSQGPGEHMEFVEAFPDRYWAWEDYRPGPGSFATQVWNAQKQLWWDSRQGGRAKQIPWTQRAARAGLQDAHGRIFLFLLESKDVRPTIVRTVEGNDTVDLFATAPGFVEIRYTIDKSTFLPRAVTLVPEFFRAGESSPRAGAATQYFLKDYRLVDGIQMPGLIEGMGQMRFIINPAVDPRLFETPPDGVNSRDEWRKFLRASTGS
jgi:hypothetical protein